MGTPSPGAPASASPSTPPGAHAPVRCWCGNASLEPFTDGYVRCPACETLATAISPAQADPRVRDDSADFYGKEYWLTRQEKEFGFPDIRTRARTDLPERCLHWLRSLLHWKLPPAKVLEVGAAHGGFVALLQEAGFDATGLELSPWVVDFARTTFGVPMLRGPIEDQSIPPKSLDVVAMMDVLEHLPDPVGTLGRCAGLLKDDGLLLVQTPEYPESRSFAELRTERHQFLTMLDPKEHLYLFSRTSAGRILRDVGLPYVEFIPAIFPKNDMSFVASRRPLTVVPQVERDAHLMGTTRGRMLLALLDLDERRLNLLEKHRALLRDRNPA